MNKTAFVKTLAKDLEILSGGKFPCPVDIVTEEVEKVGLERIMMLGENATSEEPETYLMEEWNTFVNATVLRCVNLALWNQFLAGKIEANVDPKTNEWIFTEAATTKRKGVKNVR
jgi:hypothetical protein